MSGTDTISMGGKTNVQIIYIIIIILANHHKRHQLDIQHPIRYYIGKSKDYVHVWRTAITKVRLSITLHLQTGKISM